MGPDLDFIHAADIHLDSPMRGLAGYEGAPSEELRNCTRQAFTNLVDYALERKVRLMVIAGDLYDGDWKDFNTGLFFTREMHRLRDAGIPVALLQGNHDAENQMTKSLQLPGNVHVFSAERPETLRFPELGLALHGQSFRNREVVDNLARDYPEPLAGLLNIGVLHTAVEGNAQHATYAPCSLDELSAKGYDYWALGHVHTHEVLQQTPWVVFPGNLQGRHIRETGPKGAVHVRVHDHAIAGIDFIPCDVLRWALLRIDVTGLVTTAELLETIRTELDATLARSADLPVAVRLVLHGHTKCFEAVMQNEEGTIAEIRACAMSLGAGRVWIEKIRLEIKPPPHVGTERLDALGELEAMFAGASADPALADEFRATFAELLAKLPVELRESLELAFLKNLKNGEIEPIVDEIGPYVLGRLGEAGD